MKTIKKNVLTVVILLFAISLNSQERLMQLGYVSKNIDLPENYKPLEQVPMIYNQTFSYKSKGGEVLVYFNGNEHIEYHNNKEYYIKSSIVWTSKDECIITLEEITLPDFPFRTGNSLKMKITDVRGDVVYYESTLGGRTWRGKMKQVETVEEDVIASN